MNGEVVSNAELSAESIEQLVNVIETAAKSAADSQKEPSSKQIILTISDEGAIAFEVSGIAQEAVPIWLKRAAISAEDLLLRK